MKTCVTYLDNTKEVCGEECEPGYKYCEHHRNRPKAVEETIKVASKRLGNTRNGIDMTPKNEVIVARTQAAASGEVSTVSPNNVVEQITTMLERVSNFTNDAYTAYARLSLDDWAFTDQAGSAQLRPEVSVMERALDREARVIPQIAKLGLEHQQTIIEKAQYEGIRSAITRTLVRLGFSESQMGEANKIIAEELRKLMG